MAPLFIVLIANFANFLNISLVESWSAFVSWYIPADIFLASTLGIIGFIYSLLIAIFMVIGAYFTWKDNQRGAIILFVATLINSIAQVMGLLAYIYYTQANSDIILNSKFLIGTRVIYSSILLLGNLLLFLPRK